MASVLEQGDGLCRSRILARESSTGQSSRIFYRAAEGVPFKWEMQPGMPKNPREDDVILPLCPSPLMQSLGLPLPHLDDDDEIEKKSRLWRLKKKVEVVLGRRSKLQESSRFEDCDEEFVVKGSSFSTFSSCSSSPVVDNDDPFCCSPWNVPAILEEGNTRIYYCSKHKAVFSVEEDGSFLSGILTRVSPGDQFPDEISSAGVPFRWETQPGRPTHLPENDLMVPHPRPPPAVQSLSLARPSLAGERMKKSMWKRVWIWIQHGNDKKKREIGEKQHEISFRCKENSCDGEFDASFRESGSVSSFSSVAPLSRGGSTVSKMRMGRHVSCGPLRKEDILVFARGKLKMFRS